MSRAEWLANLASGLPGVRARYHQGDQVITSTQWGRTGRVIVLIHGIGMAGAYFGLLRDALARHHRVVAIDLPGFGESPAPAEPLDIAGTADVVAGFLRERISEPVTVIGHSMGSQVAAELAARHSELVSHLVLVAPTVNPAERTVPRQALRLAQDCIGYPLRVAATGVVLYAKAGPALFTRKLRAMMNHRIETIAPAIGVPTLVLAAEHDRVCPPPWCKELAALIPGASFRVLAGRGHEAMMLDAQPLAEIVADFLA